MCGIVGFFNLGLRAEERFPLLSAMCSAIGHRGPDDEGYFSDDQVGLGMRRLSILDLVSGHQPMENEDGSKRIVFNGEIYNYRDLRSRLGKVGHRFLTTSDTEVILHQYEQEGMRCVNEFNGMFAFALWDETIGRLFLARDRMGIKPLYYYWDGQQFLFASEIKSILACPSVKRRLNLRGLWDYLTFRYVPQPETIWENIFKLAPGHTLAISIDRREPVLERYWDMPDETPLSVSDEREYLEEFERLFFEAVRLQLVADVPVGVLLSGGMDSSSVAAAIGKVHTGRLNSFSVAFKEAPAIDELPFARQVARHLGMDHHEIVIGDKEFCDFLPRLVYYTDEPLADLASVPLFYVSKLAREKVKVVLSGEGSDEILGGYNLEVTVRGWDWIRRFQRLPVWMRRGIAPRVARHFSPRLSDRLQAANIPLNERLRSLPVNMTNYFSSSEKLTLLGGRFSFPESFSWIRAEMDRNRSDDPLNQLLFIYCQSWLVEDLLMKADKMTMANSIEMRVPFLDHRLVEWAARAPSQLKVGRSHSGEYENKRVLRRFAETRLPAEILSRPKQGFPVPAYDWLKSSLKDWATGMLASPKAEIYRWLDFDPVQAQLRRGTHVDSPLMERHRLWNLLVFELWAKEWKPE